jgi:hypothetical protein
MAINIFGSKGKSVYFHSFMVIGLKVGVGYAGLFYFEGFTSSWGDIFSVAKRN